MNASLEIRKDTYDLGYNIFWCINKNGEPVENSDTYRFMAEQAVAIVSGWADPIEVE